MKTGRRVFRYKTGAYTPVISDGRRIYLVGYSSINALQPFQPKPKAQVRTGGVTATAHKGAVAPAPAEEPAQGGESAKRVRVKS